MNIEALTLEELRECEYDDISGDLVGWYADGHVDVRRFFAYALCEYQDYYEDSEDYDEEDDCPPEPFHMDDIKHLWYRLPTDEELENGEYHPNQFITSTKPLDGYKPITYLDFR